MSLFLARETMWGNYKLNCLRLFVGQVDVVVLEAVGEVLGGAFAKSGGNIDDDRDEEDGEEEGGKYGEGWRDRFQWWGWDIGGGPEVWGTL